MAENITAFPLRPQFPIAEIRAAAQALIDLLDALAGDPDLEDATDLEDEGVQLHLRADGHPGCAISDGGDIAWTERKNQTRPALARGTAYVSSAEDAEDDDPDTGCEDGRCGDDGLPGDPEDAENGHDAETETWSNWMDHPPETHIGHRPGHNDPPEAA